MKKFLSWCLATLAAAIIAIAGSVAIASCENGPKVLKPAVGVEQVANALDSIVNPQLYTTKDVFELQNKLLVNAYVDSIFMSLDQKILENVAGVCLKRLHIVTKDDVVNEFIKNRSVYENLPTNNPPDNATTPKTEEKPLAKIELIEEGKTTVTEAPPTRVEEKPAGYKDTTVNGKHALISVQQYGKAGISNSVCW